MLAALTNDSSTAGVTSEFAFHVEFHLVERLAELGRAQANRSSMNEPPSSTPGATANRDPLVFDDPDRFDITRANARRHLAFVTGPHACIGGALARLEARVAWEALLQRFPDVDRWRITGAPAFGPSQLIRGYRHLPMRFS